VFALFPGLFSFVLFFAALLVIAPALPWRMPIVRALAAAAVIYFNAKYLAWRAFDTFPSAALTPEYLWSMTVFIAEAIAVVQVSLHTLLFVRLSDRRPETDDLEVELRNKKWCPSVDIFIPTVNEPLEILERSIKAALEIDWPNHAVWVLDDGQRPWLQEYCDVVGARYITRTTNKGFKAGNINNALKVATGEFVLCVDADFIAYPQILYRTVPWMQKKDIGLVQTPGNLTNPDPIQYNLLGESAWPEEQRVFTDIVQPARDVWDNAFCYGGTFLVRRSALDEIGGMPEGSITEDLYSSYLLRAKGYVVRYLNESLSEGLAAESLASFIKQRMRWALGTLQCLYLKGGPIRGRGLTLIDRIFYFDSVVFYLSYFWPFVILIAPAVYWWTGIPPFNAAVGHLITMLLPRMFVSMIVMYWLTGRRVVPIVSELGRIVGIFHYIPSILRGIFNPFGHSFTVTLKGQNRSTYTILWGACRGFLLLGGITLAGMMLSLTRHGFRWLLWDANMPQVLAFSIFDLWLMFFAVLICIERPSGPETRLIRAATEGKFSSAVSALIRRTVS
jgi:cellulose synthase (UDP-forming)